MDSPAIWCTKGFDQAPYLMWVFVGSVAVLAGGLPFLGMLTRIRLDQRSP